MRVIRALASQGSLQIWRAGNTLPDARDNPTTMMDAVKVLRSLEAVAAGMAVLAGIRLG